MKIPFGIINGRISDKAFNRYKKLRYFLAPILKLCRFIAVQNEKYAQRFLWLGAEKDKLIIMGNLKFESAKASEKMIIQLEKEYSFLKKGNKKYFLAASTHDPEEEMILNALKDFMRRGLVQLIIAPRHPERKDQIASLLRSYNYNPLFLSQLVKMKSQNLTANDILIVDGVGQLIYFYKFCDMCFVGGSLIAQGGHNILEPLSMGKVTFFGPYMDNFSDIVQLVNYYQAAIQLDNINQLPIAVEKLLNNSFIANKLRESSQKLFVDISNDTHKVFNLINSYLKGE